jgi:hypothetical protein
MEDLKSSMLRVEDCRAVTRLVEDLRPLYTDRDDAGGEQLRWALICCPSFVECLSEGLQGQGFEDILGLHDGAANVTISQDLQYLRTGFQSFNLYDGLRKNWPPPSSIPAHTFSRRDVLAALLDFVLTGSWIIGAVRNNICYEAMNVPENIFMI